MFVAWNYTLRLLHLSTVLRLIYMST